MQNIKMRENEKVAVLRLKKALTEKFEILDFCIFGSKARGDASPDSDIDVMIEIENYTPEIESAIDDLVFEINLAHDCFISVIIFSRKELKEGPLGESPLYRVIGEEGVRV
jgi:predicted nucleotidyltransferase